jgi:hypothetical protein
MGPWRYPGPLNDKLHSCALHLSPQNYAWLIVSSVVYKQHYRIAFKRKSVFDLVVQKYCTMQAVGNRNTLDQVWKSVNEISPNTFGWTRSNKSWIVVAGVWEDRQSFTIQEICGWFVIRGNQEFRIGICEFHTLSGGPYAATILQNQLLFLSFSVPRRWLCCGRPSVRII